MSTTVPHVSLADIREARRLLEGVSVSTAMEDSRWLSAVVGGPVLLKCENLQRTGSFKIRGAYVRMLRLTEEERARGVVAASAGNHAQGVALAAQLLGIKATVFMPEGAPIPKLNATRGYGAEVVFHGALPRPVAGGGDAVLRRDRRRADPPLRPRGHRGRAGHLRARDHGAGSGRRDGADPARRRGSGGRLRHRDQGDVPRAGTPRRPGDRGPGRGRGGVPDLAGDGPPGHPDRHEDDGRRDRGPAAGGRCRSPRSWTTWTR